MQSSSSHATADDQIIAKDDIKGKKTSQKKRRREEDNGDDPQKIIPLDAKDVDQIEEINSSVDKKKLNSNSSASNSGKGEEIHQLKEQFMLAAPSLLERRSSINNNNNNSNKTTVEKVICEQYPRIVSTIDSIILTNPKILSNNAEIKSLVNDLKQYCTNTTT